MRLCLHVTLNNKSHLLLQKIFLLCLVDHKGPELLFIRQSRHATPLSDLAHSAKPFHGYMAGT